MGKKCKTFTLLRGKISFWKKGEKRYNILGKYTPLQSNRSDDSIKGGGGELIFWAKIA